MLGLFSFVLIILSIIMFLLGYAYLNNKFENLLMWGLEARLERVTDRDGYKKQLGKHSIIMGVIFLLVPVSLYLIVNFNINPKFLYIWLLVLVGATISNTIQLRKFF